jgi:hypothetical protein
MSDPRIEAWIQYTHLDKLYGYLPGMTRALPAVFGLDPESYAERTARFAAHARQAAGQLLADSSLAGRVDAVPFHPGQLVLAVGDSVTDDLQSWAEILRHLLDHTAPATACGWSTAACRHTPPRWCCAAGRRRWRRRRGRASPRGDQTNPPQSTRRST